MLAQQRRYCLHVGMGVLVWIFVSMLTIIQAFLMHHSLAHLGDGDRTIDVLSQAYTANNHIWITIKRLFSWPEYSVHLKNYCQHPYYNDANEDDIKYSGLCRNNWNIHVTCVYLPLFFCSTLNILLIHASLNYIKTAIEWTAAEVIAMTTNPDPVGKLALELLLERVLDLNHVALTARNDDANKSLVVCSETLHCLLHLQCKIPRLVPDYSHCQLHNIYALKYP